MFRLVKSTQTLAATLAGLCLIATLPALAASRDVSMQVADGQTVQYVSGLTWATYQSDAFGLGVTARANDKHTFWLTVAGFNASGENFDVLPEMISARSQQGGLHVFTADEVVHAQAKRDKWEAVGNILAAAGNQYNANQAGYYNQTGTVNGRYQGKQGNLGSAGNYNGTYNGTYSANGYDAAAAQQAQAQANAQNQALANNMKSTQAARMDGLNERLLRRQTLSTGSGIRGDVLINLPPKGRRGSTQIVQVILPIAGQDYPFLVRVTN